MKKLILGMTIAVMAFSIMSVPAFAASKESKDVAGPFEGEFKGTVHGDYGSTATLILDLTDRENIVAGTAALSSGLKVNAGGFCGKATVPASSIWVEESKSSKHPDEIAAEATIDMGSFVVNIEVEGQLSDDGETLDVQAKIDTPWICGRDPIISGILTKIG